MAITTSVVLYDPTDTSPGLRTLAGFLAGFSGRTPEAYTLDLRVFYRWCDEHRLDLFAETRHGRRLSTLAGSIPHSAHLRRGAGLEPRQ
jgi:hypothetical protein